MTEIIITDDCPICFETFNPDFNINVTITDCGHKFHTSCLMKHVSHNRFNCPCCRNKIIEKQDNIRNNFLESNNIETFFQVFLEELNRRRLINDTHNNLVIKISKRDIIWDVNITYQI